MGVSAIFKPQGLSLAISRRVIQQHLDSEIFSFLPFFFFCVCLVELNIFSPRKEGKKDTVHIFNEKKSPILTLSINVE